MQALLSALNKKLANEALQCPCKPGLRINSHGGVVTSQSFISICTQQQSVISSCLDHEQCKHPLSNMLRVHMRPPMYVSSIDVTVLYPPYWTAADLPSQLQLRNRKQIKHKHKPPQHPRSHHVLWHRQAQQYAGQCAYRI